MKTNYTLAIYGVVQKPRPFQSFVSIIYANMKDKNILFFGGIITLLSLSYWATVFVHVVTFPRGGQGEKVVVSGCGLCSPGVRLALWGAGSTRPAAHSLHSHVTWLWWRWQYGDNGDLMLVMASVIGYLFSLFVCCKERGQKKNGIMWEKFSSGGPPPPSLGIFTFFYRFFAIL